MLYGNIDVIDGIWSRAAVTNVRRADNSMPVFDYGEYIRVVTDHRHSLKYPAADYRLALLSIDKQNANQRRLKDALVAKGIDVVEIDYRHAYISVPRDEEVRDTPTPQSLSHWITYMCGLAAGAPEGQRSLCVGTGAFEVAGPLQDFVQSRGGRVTIAYFRSLLNKRWLDNGLLDDDDDRLPFKFLDLDEHSLALLGVDTRAIRGHRAERGDGGLPF